MQYKFMRVSVVVAVIVAAVLMIFPIVTAHAQQKLDYGQGTNGVLSGANPRATYTFDGKAGDKVRVTMNGLGGDIDPFVSLFNPSNQLIGQDDNGGGKLNALISGMVLPADGTYTVVAETKRQDEGKYSLIITLETNGGFWFDGTPPEGQSDKLAYQLSRPFNKNDLTYYIANGIQGFSDSDLRSVVQEAWSAWSAVVPLNFTEVSSQGQADIVIQFGSIDGPSNVLGQACPPSSPCSGQVEFDSDESWVMRQPRGYSAISFLAVATHEFGHIIGLLHSDDSSALMYPTYSPYNLKPADDDIRGAQRLYGTGQGGVNNNVTPVPGGNTGSGGTTSDPGENSVQSTIGDNPYIEFWDFDVQAGEYVTISMNALSGGLDPFLVVVDKNGNILAYDDDSGGNFNAVLYNLRFPQTGTYSVAATRYKQAQGYTSGQYQLTIQYGQVNAGSVPPPSQPTTPPNNSGGTTGSGSETKGSVTVSAIRGQLDPQKVAPLDGQLDSAFAEVYTPQTQSRNGVVIQEQTYVWMFNWCAKDQQTLQDNLNVMEIHLLVDGQQVNDNVITRTDVQQTDNGLSCVAWVAQLSNWKPGQVKIASLMRLRDNMFDGLQVYQKGDYIFEYNIKVQ